MKPEHLYQRHQSAERIEAIMIIAGFIGIIAGIYALFTHGWLTSLTLFLLGLIAVALARVIDLLADLLTSMESHQEIKKPSRPEKDERVGH